MKDILIEILSAAAKSIDIDITLTLSGTIVSGTIISVDSYFEQSEALKPVKEKIDELCAPETDNEENPNSPSPNFIHLKNAQYCSPGQPPMPQEGILMRFRIESIDGFSLGRFTTQ